MIQVIEKYGNEDKANPRYLIEPNMPRADSSGWILRFEDAKCQIKIDLMVNKISEIENSGLILNYCLIDERFRKLIYILKSWNNHISNKDFDRLNNYSIYLMLIAYMQKEKILPNLQAKANLNFKMGISSLLV